MIDYIHIQFDGAGDFTRYNLHAHWQDAEGDLHHDTYSPEQVADSGHGPALAAVVAAIVGLAAPWRATQVWATRATWQELPAEEGGEGVTRQGIELSVQARKPSGGCRRYGVADYPEFMLTAPSALDFFAHFTSSQNTNND